MNTFFKINMIWNMSYFSNILPEGISFFFLPFYLLVCFNFVTVLFLFKIKLKAAVGPSEPSCCWGGAAAPPAGYLRQNPFMGTLRPLVDITRYYTLCFWSPFLNKDQNTLKNKIPGKKNNKHMSLLATSSFMRV